MDEERRAKEIGETAEEGSQRGAGRAIIIILLYIIGIPASIIYWVLSIIFWLGCWLIAWIGFAVMFLVMWVINLFKPMPKVWGYRHVAQEDWFLSHEELKNKHGDSPSE